jgi:hypothetical protein
LQPGFRLSQRYVAPPELAVESMQSSRRIGVHEVSDEKVLLVTKHRVTGAERCDWWPSVAEAEASDMIVLEVRDRIKVEKRKSNWKGLASLLGIALWRSGTQDAYIRDRALDQREFFESIDDKLAGRPKS